ncbi:MAG: DUF2061 domain-containing protein, partial [Deltaproteobacteria bacterium]|nr:DUF2061 domain-containing protein [Deltaproteobacteria bacterium]
MNKAWKKSLSWNAIAFSVTTVICYLVTGKLEVAGSVGLIERAIKIIVYPYHERFW